MLFSTISVGFFTCDRSLCHLILDDALTMLIEIARYSWTVLHRMLCDELVLRARFEAFKNWKCFGEEDDNSDNVCVCMLVFTLSRAHIHSSRIYSLEWANWFEYVCGTSIFNNLYGKASDFITCEWNKHENVIHQYT